jgi:hypothetical protein
VRAMSWLTTGIGRILVSLFVPAVTFLVLMAGIHLSTGQQRATNCDRAGGYHLGSGRSSSPFCGLELGRGTTPR